MCARADAAKAAGERLQAARLLRAASLPCMHGHIVMATEMELLFRAQELLAHLDEDPEANALEMKTLNRLIATAVGDVRFSRVVDRLGELTKRQRHRQGDSWSLCRQEMACLVWQAHIAIRTYDGSIEGQPRTAEDIVRGLDAVVAAARRGMDAVHTGDPAGRVPTLAAYSI